MSGMMGVLQFATKWSNNAHNFLCMFVFFLPHISIVVLVVWERASRKRFSIIRQPVSRTYQKSKKLVQP
jgi:hypothetical protein